MKLHIFFILFIALSLTSIAQHRDLEWIKEYYNSINRVEKIEHFHNENVQQIMWWAELFVSAGHSFNYSSRLQELESVVNRLRGRSERVLVFLYFQTKDIENFNFNKDINDFITIDTNRTRIVYFNRRSREYITLSEERFRSRVLRPLRGSGFWPRDIDRIRYFSFINRTRPDVLFYERGIFSADGYLFMKNNKMFLYSAWTRRVYELNEFIRENFEEEDFIQSMISDRRRWLPTSRSSEQIEQSKSE